MNRSDHENTDDLEEWSDDYSGEVGENDALQLLQQRGSQPVLSLTVLLAEEGLRFDRLLAQHFPDVSRSRIQKWVADGCATLDGKPCKTSHAVRTGQRVEIRPPVELAVNDWGAEPSVLRGVEIVFEDAEVLVVNKPAGLVVHPAAGHADGTLVNGLLAHCSDLSKVARCGIVHRLDRDTTGLMVVAKTAAAQFSLVQQLQQRSVSREYLALVWGSVRKQTIRSLMGRDSRDRQRMAVLSEMRIDPLADEKNSDKPTGRGKEAITHIEPIASGQLFGLAVTAVRCKLETGRTHQIRVHMEHLGNPIVGDQTYSRRSPHASKLGGGYKELQHIMPHQALHALRLHFKHPASGERIDLKANPPANFIELLNLASIKLGKVF